MPLHHNHGYPKVHPCLRQWARMLWREYAGQEHQEKVFCKSLSGDTRERHRLAAMFPPLPDLQPAKPLIPCHAGSSSSPC